MRYTTSQRDYKNIACYKSCKDLQYKLYTVIINVKLKRMLYPFLCFLRHFTL